MNEVKVNFDGALEFYDPSDPDGKAKRYPVKDGAISVSDADLPGVLAALPDSALANPVKAAQQQKVKES